MVEKEETTLFKIIKFVVFYAADYFRYSFLSTAILFTLALYFPIHINYFGNPKMSFLQFFVPLGLASNSMDAGDTVKLILFLALILFLFFNILRYLVNSFFNKDFLIPFRYRVLTVLISVTILMVFSISALNTVEVLHNSYTSYIIPIAAYLIAIFNYGLYFLISYLFSISDLESRIYSVLNWLLKKS